MSKNNNLVMNDMKFSICIPNYNYSKYIGETIQSVLDQSYTNFEIIVADNASDDNSISVIKSFNDDRIRVVKNNYNIGFSPNLDKATESAIGDYMILLSSDDLMLPDALSTFARNIDQYDGLNQPLVLISSINIIDEKNNKKSERYALIHQIVNGLKNENTFQDNSVSVYDGYALLKHALSNNFVIVGRFLSTCYSRKLFESVEGYNSITSIMPDTHFSHKLMFLNPKTIIIKEAFFSYRIHSNNNYASIFKNIKLGMDAYTLTNLYSDELLKPLGIDGATLKINFINYWGCHSVWNFALAGKLAYSLKLWHLAWSTYPQLYRKKITAWIFPFMVPFIAILRMGIFKHIYNAIKKVTSKFN